MSESDPLLRRRDLVRGAAAAAAMLPIAACSRSSGPSGKGEEHAELEPLVVGGLPVTCNLTLPIACTARQAATQSKKTGGRSFEYSKYSGWPELKESLMAGRIQAAFMLAPLIMDLVTK